MTPYEEGVEAARQGRGWISCPYSDAYRYKAWMAGYDSIRHCTGYIP